MEADVVINKNYFNFQTCSFHHDDSGVKLVMMGQFFLQYSQRMGSSFRLGKALCISTQVSARLLASTNVSFFFFVFFVLRFGFLTLTLHLVHLVKLSRKNPLISSLQNSDFLLASYIFGKNDFLTESLFFKVSVQITLSVEVLLGSFWLVIYLCRASVAFLSPC